MTRIFWSGVAKNFKDWVEKMFEVGWHKMFCGGWQTILGHVVTIFFVGMSDKNVLGLCRSEKFEVGLQSFFGR